MTPELNMKIALWRQKCADGSISVEEMQEAILILRQGRLSAITTAKKASSKKPSKSADELLNELENI